MTELIIKDNSLTSKKGFNEISNITERIADKTLKQLNKEGVFVFPELIKDAEDISKDQIILESINDYYRSSNIMGFLGYGKESLIIESRFSTGKDDYFFQYLLECVLEFPNILELNTDANRDSLIFNMLLFIFPHYLKKAMRKGVFKTYILNQYNDANLKGVIDISRHISKNIPFTGNIAYNQREFSYNNDLMHLIRHTIEYIKKKAHGRKILQKSKDEVALVVEVTNGYEYYDRRKVIAKNIKNPIRHAYFREYRALQHLCIMILQHEKHHIGTGIREVHGILFDGSWIWEEYINLLIGSEFYHPMNKGGKGAQRLFAGNIGLIYPDFISHDTSNRIIADAKYKPHHNINASDYQQLLAYMFRFDAKKGFYLYPQSRVHGNIELRMNSGSTYEKNVCPRDDVIVYKCGLKIPDDAVDYEEFKVKIKRSEGNLQNIVLNNKMKNEGNR